MNRGKLIPISPIESPPAEEAFNNDLIYQQLNKIIAHPIFSGSEILCKFLFYIVHETLTGNANTIKEYTIAVKVLNKPKHFEPQKDAIVRIHASRLRRTLIKYYKSSGGDDEVIISIPKGRYIPIFQPFRLMITAVADNFKFKQGHHVSNKVNIAIMPFRTHEKKISRIAFTESLGQTLSFGLNKEAHFSIISYNIIREQEQDELKIRHLAENVNLIYVLSGDVHFENESIRIFVRLIDITTRHQVWSDIYNFNSRLSGYFELSDLITSRVIRSLQLVVSDKNQSDFNEYQIPDLPVQNKKLLKTN